MTTKTNLAQPAYNSLSWDTPLNSNFGILNNALGGVLSVNAASGDVTLTGSQAQNAVIAVSGTLTANRFLYIPSGTTGFWIVTNGTAGAYTLTVANVAGSATALVTQGSAAIIASDGTNCVFANNAASAGSVPPGTIIQYAATMGPYGYLACDGSAVSRATYSSLFSAIGTAWGTGDGSTTFNLPDLRGYFLRGLGTNSDGTASGTFATKIADMVGPHNHTITDPGHAHTYTKPQSAGGGTTISATSISASGTTGTATTGITINNNSGTETRPRNIAVPYFIKY